MRTLGLLLSIILWIGTAVPARAQTIEVLGQGLIPGTTTVYTCTQLSEFPPFCPSQTSPDVFHFFVTETVDIDALSIGHAFFSEQIGNFAFADFSIALIGKDQWGNYLFEGQDLTIYEGVDWRACFDTRPCTEDEGTFSAPTFSVAQVSPALVPEPATWLSMLLGFAAMGFALRRNSLKVVA